MIIRDNYLRSRDGEAFCYFKNKVKWSKCLVAGEPEADQGDRQTPEPGGAPKALAAGDTPTAKTKSGYLQADPGGLTVINASLLYANNS